VEYPGRSLIKFNFFMLQADVLPNMGFSATRKRLIHAFECVKTEDEPVFTSSDKSSQQEEWDSSDPESAGQSVERKEAALSDPDDVVVDAEWDINVQEDSGSDALEASESESKFEPSNVQVESTTEVPRGNEDPKNHRDRPDTIDDADMDPSEESTEDGLVDASSPNEQESEEPSKVNNREEL
jgi:hypothetical protein